MAQDQLGSQELGFWLKPFDPIIYRDGGCLMINFHDMLALTP